MSRSTVEVDPDPTNKRQGGPGPLVVTRRQSDDVRALAAQLNRGADGLLRDALTIGMRELERRAPAPREDGSAYVRSAPDVAEDV